MARRNKGEERSIATERVARLVTLADAALRRGRPDLADRYARLAWRLKLTYRLRPSPIDARACRACGAFLTPGLTSRVRMTGGKRTTTCLQCGDVRRRPLHGTGPPRNAPAPHPDADDPAP